MTEELKEEWRKKYTISRVMIYAFHLLISAIRCIKLKLSSVGQVSGMT
jgi:hypothetical protein